MTPPSKYTLYLILLISFAISCKNKTDKNQNIENVFPYYLPFDTNEALKNIILIDSACIKDEITKNNDSLYDLDTFELKYNMCACGTHPDWLNERYFNSVYRKIFNKKYSDLVLFANPSKINDSAFINEFVASYYIEPVSKDVEIPDAQLKGGNKIVFTGRLYRKPKLPPIGVGYEGNPHVAITLLYSGYKMIHPYNIRGPKKLIGFWDDEDKDSVFCSVTIKIK